MKKLSSSSTELKDVFLEINPSFTIQYSFLLLKLEILNVSTFLLSQKRIK